jgi:hypothetical protein
MKSILNRIVALLVIGTFTGALAFGKTTQRELTITTPLTVNHSDDSYASSQLTTSYLLLFLSLSHLPGFPRH